MTRLQEGQVMQASAHAESSKHACCLRAMTFSKGRPWWPSITTIHYSSDHYPADCHFQRCSFHLCGEGLWLVIDVAAHSSLLVLDDCAVPAQNPGEHARHGCVHGEVAADLRGLTPFAESQASFMSPSVHHLEEPVAMSAWSVKNSHVNGVHGL